MFCGDPPLRYHKSMESEQLLFDPNEQQYDLSDYDREQTNEAYEHGVPIPELLEEQGFVRAVPRFQEQLQSQGGTNEIEYVPGCRRSIESDEWNDPHETAVATERETLVALDAFLQKVEAESPVELDQERATSMRENLSVITRENYEEAVAGIADYWRAMLESNDAAQICAITGRIRPGGKVKSDAFLLDNIISQFSDEELVKYHGRIVTDPRGITTDPQNARVILLDDWPISGSQMVFATTSLSNDYPELRHSMQVQVVAATPQKIKEGIDLVPNSASEFLNGAPVVPVRSYFVAQPVLNTLAPHSGAHLTGYYCSVDYGYNRLIAEMAQHMDVDMPPGTNIVRPYHNGPPLVQVARLGEPDYGPPVQKKFRRIKSEYME